MKSEGQLKRSVVTGTVWKFMERIIAQGTSFLVSIVLARLLDPTHYSIVGFVTIFFMFANVLIDGGFNTALMQKKEIDKEEYSSVFVASTLLAVVVYLVLFFTAPAIANLYDEQLLIPIIRVMGLALPVTAVKSIWCAYISSTFQFKKFFFATIGGTIASGIVGITMALMGFGPWALVAQNMTNTVIDTIILIVSTRIGIRIMVNWKKLKALLKYGWKILASKLLAVTFQKVNPLVIGIIYPKEYLSLYTKGESFPDLISQTTTNTLAAVLFPFLAKFQDDKKKLLEYTRLFIRVASYICFPLMMGFFVCADNFVLALLTEKWVGAVPFVRVFCVACMFEMLNVGNCQTIKAMGRSGTYLIMEIIKKVSYFLILLLFIVFGKSPLVLAYGIIVCNIVALIVNTYPNKILIGYKYRLQLMDILPNLILTAVMCVPVYFIGKLTFTSNHWILLALQIVSGIIIYVVGSIVTKNKNMKTTINMVKTIFKKGNGKTEDDE